MSAWSFFFSLSLMRRMKSDECSCGVVAVYLEQRGYISFFFKSKYRVRFYVELYIG